MRRWLPLALILVLSGLGLAQTLPSGHWITHVSDPGSFTAQFPIAPHENTEVKNVEPGQIVTHMLTALDGDFLCGVGYTDYPVDIDAEKELVLDRDNFAKAVNATVSTSQRKDFTRGPNDLLPAMDFMAENSNGTFKALVIVVNRRAYVVVTFTRKGSDRAADIERFFASFKLTSKKS